MARQNENIYKVSNNGTKEAINPITDASAVTYGSSDVKTKLDDIYANFAKKSELPKKMSDLQQDVETGKIDSITLNGSKLTIGEDKNVNIDIPTGSGVISYNESEEALEMKVSATGLGDSVYVTKTELQSVNSAITEQSNKITELDKKVSSLELGGVSEETVKQAVKDYLDKNGVDSGLNIEELEQYLISKGYVRYVDDGLDEDDETTILTQEQIESLITQKTLSQQQVLDIVNNQLGVIENGAY